MTTTTEDLNKLAQTVHRANAKWWQNIDTGEPLKRNPRELLMLIISELSEAMEGERKNLMDDKLPHRKMAEVEMADAYIRILDFAAGFGVRLDTDTVVNSFINNKAEELFSISKVICFLDDVVDIDRYETGKRLSFALALIEGYCRKHGYDLEGAFHEKTVYNATREDHTHEALRIAGGKQF